MILEFESQGLREKAGRKGSLTPEQWRAQNLATIEALERPYRAATGEGIVPIEHVVESLQDACVIQLCAFRHRLIALCCFSRSVDGLPGFAAPAVIPRGTFACFENGASQRARLLFADTIA